MLTLLLAVTACGDPGQLGRSIVSPSDVTSHVAIDAVPVYGAEMTVTRNDDTRISGEILAASTKTVTLFVDHQSITNVPAADIRRGIVTRYRNGGLVAALSLWSAIGGVAGVSHGILASIGEPIWGAVSAGAIVPVAGDEGRFAFVERVTDLTFLHEYARFPQGLPPEFAAKAR